jgi:PAS domain S-box-containing protein
MRVVSENTARQQDTAGCSELSAVLLDLAPDGILAIDESGRIARINAVAARLLGGRSAELEGLNLIDLLRPSVRGDGMAWLRDVQGRGGVADVCVSRADGSLASLQLAVRAIQFEGRILFACYLRETHGRRRGDPITQIASQCRQRAHAPDRRRTPSSGLEPLVQVVVEDSVFRLAMTDLLQRCGWKAEGMASLDALLASPSARVPGCVVFDAESRTFDAVALRGRMVEFTWQPVIFIARNGGLPPALRAMRVGAFDVLPKPPPDNVLLAATRSAIAFSTSELERTAVAHSIEARFLSLTSREQDVMRGVVSGLLNKQVAAELGIAEITVKAHRGRVMRKMHAHSLAELVNFSAILGVTASWAR